ncbi:MAG TPA: hypothetical protein VM581_00590, partial [Magnetospirillaceae bacterium]|nr:hypothetical protein [Magnetospirillaceae bacterium]
MSNDSSKPHNRWWRQPSKEWGVIASILVAALALYAPMFLVHPVAQAFMPMIPLGANLKVAVVTTTVMVLSVGIIAAALAVYGKNLRDIGLAKPTFVMVAKVLIAFVVYIGLSIGVQTVA